MNELAQALTGGKRSRARRPQQERRKHRKNHLRPVNLRVTSRTESDHQMQNSLARFAMMHSGDDARTPVQQLAKRAVFRKRLRSW